MPTSIVTDSNSLGPFVTPPVSAPTVGWAPFKGPADALSGSDWYDISPYLISVVGTRRGRQYETNQFQSGTATLILDNNGRDFDPMLVSSSMGSLSPTGTWTNAQLLPLKRFRVAMFYRDHTNVLNGPNYSNDPTNANTTFPIFTGYCEGFVPSWEGASYGTVSVTLSDAFRLLQNVTVGAATNFATGLGATLTGSATGVLGAGACGQQIAAVLDAIGWPGASAYASATNRAIDADTDTALSSGTVDNHQTKGEAITLTSDQAALTLLQTIADTEIGQLFVTADGSVAFHDRAHRRRAARSRASQGTFSDQE